MLVKGYPDGICEFIYILDSLKAHAEYAIGVVTLITMKYNT